jgi:hypothetical protein
MAGEQGATVTVVQREERVLISVPLVGFPAGFQLRAGERVVLVTDASGPAVRPLVHSAVVDASIQDLSTRGALTLDGHSYALQSSTVFGDPTPAHAAAPRGCVVWVVDSSAADGPRRVIAVRPVQDAEGVS